MSLRGVTPSLRGLGLPARDSDDARVLVIKVKYGGTLKRFNARVNGSHFDHNLATLRSKIANAFKFSPNDEFLLTYTDDDGDIVMLDDDDDLRDAAINQKLNPLRIDVQLNSTSSGAKQQASDSGSLLAAAMEEQRAFLKSAIDEELKFVPQQPKLEVQAARSSVQPTLVHADSSSVSNSDHLPHLSKMLMNNRAAGSATVSDSHSSYMPPPKALGLTSVLAEETKTQVEQAPGYTSVENPSVLGSSGGKLIYPRIKRTDAENKGKSHAQIRGKSISSLVPPVPYMDQGVPCMDHDVPTFGSSTEYGRSMYIPYRSYGRTLGGFPPSGPQYCPIPPLESNGEIYNDYPCDYPVPTVESTGKISGEHSVFPPPRGPMHGPGADPALNAMINGWNGKVNGGSQTIFPPPPAYDHNPFKSSMHPYGFHQVTNTYGGAYGSIPQQSVHKWVECDCCGMKPIIGSRYKSTVKDDYDLCSHCFLLTGNEAEYTRMDKPMSLSERLRGFDKNPRLQLDCRFIKDLTVPDGTVMAPSTPFRKIWCMRNSGSTAWPFGTQLTWTGGDQFARQSSVKLGISESGFPVGGEIDVCVDFVAPAKPGRYISYWRLTSPDLLKFGQQIWVLIQVEQPVQTSDKNHTAAINLNLPADGNSTTSNLNLPVDGNSTTSMPSMVEQPVQNSGNERTAAINLNLPAEGTAATWTDSSSDSDNDDEDKIAVSDVIYAFRCQRGKGSKAVGSVVPCAPPGVELVQVPITHPHTSSAGAVAVPASVPASEAAALPKHISAPAPLPAATPVNSPDAPVSVPAARSPDEVFSDMEEKLLMELADMGFRQVDLNKEVLRQNEYDLQKSVDDLCGFHEWDPLLAELKELGFDDDTDIKEALAKDEGASIMKLNLLSREKDQ